MTEVTGDSCLTLSMHGRLGLQCGTKLRDLSIL